MKYSMISILVLVSAIGIQLHSRFALNLGLSIAMIALVISLPATYSLRDEICTKQRTSRNVCALIATCASLNIALLAGIFICLDLPSNLKQ
ncbi:hypothetical protein MFFC18_25940 [Mariniblastus fucicola]|uniref:Uncharacterized protein n=1 Tax=Mariniblastus fucicola TaxID=980251 RepID=A0A5B9PIY3_9BACT|nr:hypothetical protein MFFC18_25940 [Mariniblastus fucicola]